MAYSGGQPVKKNTEFLLVFPIYDDDGDLVSSAAGLDSEVSKDGAGFNDCTNEASEIGSSGIYKLTLTADEMNADVVAVITKTTTANAKTTATVIYTSSNQVDTVDTVVDAILADTNELQGLISASKIAAQVKGMDADTLTASALKTDAVTEIVTAIFAKTGITESGAGTNTFAEILTYILSGLKGKITKSENIYTFYDTDDTTVLFTVTIGINSRTVA